MKILLDSTCRNFLNLYEPNIIFLDEAKICEDSYSVKYFIEDTGLNMDEIKNELGFNANKNHISIPKGTKARVVAIKGSGDETILEVNGVQFECYLTKDADFCYVEATPLNSEFEKVFSKKPTSRKDNITLYGINIIDLIEAVNEIYGFDNKKFAYEELKLITEKEAIRTYNQWYIKNRLFDKQ